MPLLLEGFELVEGARVRSSRTSCSPRNWSGLSAVQSPQDEGMLIYPARQNRTSG